MKKSVWLVALMVTFCSWTVAYGETADGLTPAEESVCDKAGYTGALWGLCNAYCEAMDCDNKAVNAADAACDKVLDNFISKSAGKHPACEKFGKPCKEQCSTTYDEDKTSCIEQYEKALKACKPDDLSCLKEADIILSICTDNAKQNYNICLKYCSKECTDECYDLHVYADERCYDKFCKNTDCDIKLLDACLDNNYYLFKECIERCGKISGPVVE
jgi:hypothetical protein